MSFGWRPWGSSEDGGGARAKGQQCPKGGREHPAMQQIFWEQRRVSNAGGRAEVPRGRRCPCRVCSRLRSNEPLLLRLECTLGRRA